MEDVIARNAAFIKWFAEQMANNPEQAAEWGERLMADPNQRRLRPLFETHIGTLPFALKQGDAWGVAKGNTLWSCKRRQDGDVFTLGDHVVGVKKSLTYELHEDLILVQYRERDTRETRVFRFEGTTWCHTVMNNNLLTMIAVRSDSIVFQHDNGTVMVEDIATRTVTFPFGDARFGGHALGNVHVGEDWLLAGCRHNGKHTFMLAAGGHAETLIVDGTDGPMKVCPRFDRNGKFVNVCVSLYSTTRTAAVRWHHGTRLSVLIDSYDEVIERAIAIDGNTWVWLRPTRWEDGGRLEVNGEFLPKFDGLSALAVKDGMVCVLCANPEDRRKLIKDTLFVCAPNGTVRVEVNQVDELSEAVPLQTWPFVRRLGGEYALVHIEEDGVTIGSVMLPGGPVMTHRKGVYLFVTGEIVSSGEWMTVAYHESMCAFEPGNTVPWVASLTTRKPVDLTSVVALCHGKLIAVMQRSPIWVTVHSRGGGQYGLDYTEARDIVVDDGFVTFVARDDRDIVRVRVPR